MELYFLLLLFVIMIAALGSGFPVAFALPGAAIITIALATVFGWLFFDDVTVFFAQDGPVQWLSAGVTNFRGVYWEVERDTLIAIPLFIFMGIMLQRSRIAEDLLVTMAKLFGPVPGGLGISVVLVGALLAATTGIVGATVVAMGLISLPAMMRNKYSPSLASGTICASGTLGQIIPPSIVLIILADQLSSASDQASSARKALYKHATGEVSMPSSLDVLSTSAGDMFLGAFLPGLVLVGLYLAYILIAAILRPSTAPAVPNEGGFDKSFAVQVFFSLVPPLVLIFVVLGSIVAGVATVNQAGAIGAAGATIMAGYRLYEGRKNAFHPAILAISSLVIIGFMTSLYDLNVRNLHVTGNQIPVAITAVAVTAFMVAMFWSGLRTLKTDDTLKGVMLETAKTTSMVFIILLGAAMLTAAFRGFGGEEFVKHFLTGLPGGFWTQFFVVMLVIFLLGFFLDFIEIAVVVVPIVAPILLADPGANVTAVWLGVMIGVNMQTSFLTPPFGFALFYLRGVASKAITTLSIYRGVIPFIGLQLFALVIVGSFPQLVNYLPNRFYLSSYNAPPPVNPKLEACVEEYLAEELIAQRPMLEVAIAEFETANFSGLPKKIADGLKDVPADARASFDRLADVEAEFEGLAATEVTYASMHAGVRTLERQIRLIEGEAKETSKQIRRTDDADEIAVLEAKLEVFDGEIAALRDQIPAEWADAQDAYQAQLKSLSKAQRKYRNTLDDGYQPVRDLIAVVSEADGLAAFEPRLAEVLAELAGQSDEDAAVTIKAFEGEMKTVAGINPVKSMMSKARRDLAKGKTEKGRDKLSQVSAIMADEIAWRQAAQDSVMPALIAYRDAAAMTIGLRSQSRLPDDIVPRISSCKAKHRDISLRF